MTAQRIRTVILQQTGIDPDVIGHDGEFLQAYNLDSLDFISLVMHLEQEFDIKIPDDDLPKLTTFKATVEYVKTAKKSN